MSNIYCQTSFVITLGTPEQRKDLYEMICVAADEDEPIGVDVDFSPDGELWVRADEYFNVDTLALTIHQWMVKHQIKGGIEIGWANSCDKMKLNHFDGGHCLITRLDILWSYEIYAKQAAKALEQAA